MLSYSYLMSDAGPNSGHYVELQEAKLIGLIRLVLEMAEVDEAWYLETNPDVAAAVAAGALPSGKTHYITSGYFENRLPRPVVVDEDWYLRAYPDVAAAIRAGTVPSASVHFNGPGLREGRLPRPGWSLLCDSMVSPGARPRQGVLA